MGIFQFPCDISSTQTSHAFQFCESVASGLVVRKIGVKCGLVCSDRIFSIGKAYVPRLFFTLYPRDTDYKRELKPGRYRNVLDTSDRKKSTGTPPKRRSNLGFSRQTKKGKGTGVQKQHVD